MASSTRGRQSLAHSLCCWFMLEIRSHHLELKSDPQAFLFSNHSVVIVRLSLSQVSCWRPRWWTRTTGGQVTFNLCSFTAGAQALIRLLQSRFRCSFAPVLLLFWIFFKAAVIRKHKTSKRWRWKKIKGPKRHVWSEKDDRFFLGSRPPPPHPPSVL